MIWEELTTEAFAQIDRKIPVVLPVAATEQHGPHLPLATDKLIGQYFCRQLHERLQDQVLILPVISVGCSDHHLGFAGSLSVQHETLLRHMTDIFTSVLHHGFRNLIMFNSHGGNQAIGQVFVEQFGYAHSEANVHLITWWKIAFEALKDITDSGFGGTGHAGEFETSLMMLIQPDLVKRDLIQPQYPLPASDWEKADMLHAPKISRYKTFREMTKAGAFGDPTKSSAEKGQRIADSVLDACEQVVREIASR